MTKTMSWAGHVPRSSSAVESDSRHDLWRNPAVKRSLGGEHHKFDVIKSRSFFRKGVAKLRLRSESSLLAESGREKVTGNAGDFYGIF